MPIPVFAANQFSISLSRIDYEIASMSMYCTTDIGGPGDEGVSFACGNYIGLGADFRYERVLRPAISLIGEFLYTEGESGSPSAQVTHALATVGFAWNFSGRGQVSLQAGYSTFVPGDTGIFSRKATWQPAFGVFLGRKFAADGNARFMLQGGYLLTRLNDYYVGMTNIEALVVQAGVSW